MESSLLLFSTTDVLGVSAGFSSELKSLPSDFFFLSTSFRSSVTTSFLFFESETRLFFFADPGRSFLPLPGTSFSPPSSALPPRGVTSASSFSSDFSFFLGRELEGNNYLENVEYTLNINTLPGQKETHVLQSPHTPLAKPISVKGRT
jgi:hypothetical protein